MKLPKQDWAGVAYMALIAATVFSPEVYGATLKYGVVQLALLLGLCGIKVRFTRIKIIALSFLAVVLISTAFSSFSYGEKTNFRSLCILIVSFLLLSDVVLPAHILDRIKSFYIGCVVLCGIIVAVRFPTITRDGFLFIWDRRDTNYLLAFMLPGCYLAARRLLFAKNPGKMVNILAVMSTLLAILLFQRRASFLTFLLAGFVLMLEYLVGRNWSRTKALCVLAIPLIVVLCSSWFLSSAEFSRLNSRESYEDNIRLTIWDEALSAFREHPVLGSGTGVSSYYSYLATTYQSHNNYIDILGDYGIVGSACFLALVLAIVWDVPREKLHMLAYAISILFPLGFINGLQTLAFWVPLLLLVHERNYLAASLSPGTVESQRMIGQAGWMSDNSRGGDGA